MTRPGPKIGSSFKHWTVVEDDKIRARYPRVGSAGLLDALPGRSRDSIKARAVKLGVTCAYKPNLKPKPVVAPTPPEATLPARPRTLAEIMAADAAVHASRQLSHRIGRTAGEGRARNKGNVDNGWDEHALTERWADRKRRASA